MKAGLVEGYPISLIMSPMAQWLKRSKVKRHFDFSKVKVAKSRPKMLGIFQRINRQTIEIL